MSEKVSVIRKIFGKNSFTNVVDTAFNELIPPESQTTEQELTNVTKFFQDYESLFYDIPPSGSESTHLQLVVQSSEYIGLSVTDMQEEILNLRAENVSLKNQLYVLSQKI